ERIAGPGPFPGAPAHRSGLPGFGRRQARSFPPVLFSRETLQDRDLPHPRRDRERWGARHRDAGLDIAHQPRLSGDARAGADIQMAGETGLTSRHDKITELRAAGNPDLTGQNAAPAEHHIVPDLHELIDHSPGPTDRVLAAT